MASQDEIMMFVDQMLSEFLAIAHQDIDEMTQFQGSGWMYCWLEGDLK